MKANLSNTHCFSEGGQKLLSWSGRKSANVSYGQWSPPLISFALNISDTRKNGSHGHQYDNRGKPNHSY